MKMRSMNALLLAGVTSLAALAAQAQEEKRLQVMGWVGLFDFQKAGWERIVEAFEEANPGVTVDYVGTPFEDTLNQATIAILGNNAPDVIQVVSGWVPQLTAMDAIEPLSTHLPAEEIGLFPQSSIEAVSEGEDVMALPWIPGPIVMGYNRDLLERAGLDPDAPPATWDEFTAAVDKICALGDDGAGQIYGVSLRSDRNPNSAHWSLPIIWANGGEVIGEDGTVRFDTPEVRKAYEWYADVIGRGCSPESFGVQESRNIFAQGRAGFIFEGPWLRGLIDSLSGGAMTVAADGDVWVAPMPAGPDGEVRQIENSNMLVMTKQAEDKELAARFISFVLGNPEAVEYYYETASQLTTGRLDLLESGAMGADPYVQAFVKVLPVSDPVPIKDPQWNAIMDAVAPALQSIIRGGDAETELAKADREIGRIVGQ